MRRIICNWNRTDDNQIEHLCKPKEKTVLKQREICTLNTVDLYFMKYVFLNPTWGNHLHKECLRFVMLVIMRLIVGVVYMFYIRGMSVTSIYY